MNVSDILIMLRSRLKDNNFESLRFSDTELLDTLNITYNKLISELDYNIRHFSAHLTYDEPTLHIGESVLKIINALINNFPIPREAYTQVLRDNPTIPTLYEKSPQSYTITPFKECELSIYANVAHTLQNLEDELLFDSLFAPALTQGSIKSLLEIETNAQNLAKIQLYESLYNKELDFLRAHINKRREPSIHKTPFIKT